MAEILELIGVERVGLPGTTVALAMLNDAVKKGGAMATSRAGGLSGAFIPVSEDAGFAAAAADGHLVLEKLEAMTAVCSVGLDMIALPGDTSAQTLAAIIADEAAIGVINHKTTAVPPGPGTWCRARRLGRLGWPAGPRTGAGGPGPVHRRRGAAGRSRASAAARPGELADQPHLDTHLQLCPGPVGGQRRPSANSSSGQAGAVGQGQVAAAAVPDVGSAGCLLGPEG